jgi:biopolymer transport protein ExbD
VAINVGSNGGRRPGRNIGALAEINVTPFVDVVLVLLIIFMITAHVVEYGIVVNVPKTQETHSETKDLPIVEITKTGNIFYGKKPANIHELVDKIHKQYKTPPAVYLRADAETQFDIVVKVLSILDDAKLPVSIVTQPLDSHARR